VKQPRGSTHNREMPKLRVLTRIARLIGALGVVAVAHLLDIGGTSRLSLWADMFNAGHVVLMGAFSLVMLGLSADVLSDRIANRLGHYVVALCATVLVGGLSEVAQIPGPRNADVLDVARDAVGAFCFLSLYAIRDQRLGNVWTVWGRWSRAAVAVVALAVLILSWSSAIRWPVAYYRRNATFPILATFDSRVERLFWTTRNATLTPSVAPPNWSRSVDGTVGQLISDPSTRSGFAINKAYPNWSGYESLTLSVYLDSDTSATFIVQIEDSHFRGARGDRFTFSTEIEPGANVLVVPLENSSHLPGGRALDLERISRVFFLTRDTTRAITLYVDDIVLK
jgi:hypothetical protein